MGFDQYHEPPEELSQETRSTARMIVSLIEEAEAINWYSQRLHVEQDGEAKKILDHARKEEYLHFAMDLNWLIKRNPQWKKALQGILFQEGDVTELAEEVEDEL